MNGIYLDHAATSPVHPDVIKVMLPSLEEVYGNPSSIHQFGRNARKAIDIARRVAASSINTVEKNITFTSGGTEADNLALVGTALANQHKGKHIITTTIEHHATLHAAEYLEKLGFKVTYLPVEKSGQISIADLEEVLSDETILVSVMMVNNETGIIQPIEEIGKLLKNHPAYFHTDAVQAYGLLDIDVDALGVDLLTVSSHKINGPKGVGFLYIREGVKLQAIQYGGQQERKRRPGTENVAGIIGFQKAIEISQDEKEKRAAYYRKYKRLFLDTLQSEKINYQVNGDMDKAVPSIVNISFPGNNVEILLTNFDLAGIAASSGSACTAGSVEPSHVLSAMYGSENERTINSVRFSFGLSNSEAEVNEAAKRAAAIVKRLVK